MNPPFRKVDVKADSVAEADFTIKSTLKLRLQLGAKTALADGFSSVPVTVTATDDNGPVYGVAFSLRPFGGGSRLESAWDMKVPGTICAAAGSRVWPAPVTTGSPDPSTEAVDLTTDATGEAHLVLWPGTVPGEFPITVWAQDAKGRLIRKNINDISDEATVTVRVPPTTANSIIAALKAYVTNTPSAVQSLPIDANALFEQLTGFMSAHTFPSFALAPISTKTSSVVLVSPIAPGAARVKVDAKTGVVVPPATDLVIAPNGILPLSGLQAAGGFWGLVEAGTGAGASFPTVSSWLANGAGPSGYTFPGNAGPVSLTTRMNQLYLSMRFGLGH